MKSCGWEEMQISSQFLSASKCVGLVLLCLTTLISSGCTIPNSDNLDSYIESPTRYAYIPILRQDGAIKVVDTQTMELVDTIFAVNPTSVAINSDGTKVYVTERYIDRPGDVMVIDSTINKDLPEAKISEIGEQPSGLIYHQLTNSLYVTHNGGVTKVQLDDEGLPSGEVDLIPVDYNSGAIDSIGNFIFSTGPKIDSDGKTIDSGISMINANNTGFQAIVNEVSLKNVGSIGITIDPRNYRVFVSNRKINTVSILTYASSQLELQQTITLDHSKGPLGLSYAKDFDSLFIASTAVEDPFGYLPPSSETPSQLVEINLSNDAKQKYYTLGTAVDAQYVFTIQPLAVHFVSETNTIYVVKYIGANVGAGTYLSKIKTDLIGVKLETEQEVLIDSTNRPEFIGRFVGPICEKCKASRAEILLAPRQSAFDLIGIFIFLTIVFSMRYKRNIYE
ncbi:MAG: hypothetical protein OEZ43_02875 [Gammaproteobacteria bacterium]|nr:hypothetical protein [Gammaproteobacteria bacterium]